MPTRTVYAICDDDCRFETLTREQIITSIEQAVQTGTVSDPDGAVISKLKEIRANGTVQVWNGTQAQFNALSPAPTVGNTFVRVGTDGVLYICTDDEQMNALLNHIADKNNPHGVTLNQLTGGNAVTVGDGGTGQKSFTAGEALIGNGSGALTTRAITDTNKIGGLSEFSSNLATTNTIAYWDGSWGDSNSNLSKLGTVKQGTWQASPIGIPYGGTNATTADNACANLGAVKKSGDTMTGSLTTTGFSIIPGHIYPTMQLYKTANGNYVSYGAVMDDAFLAQIIYQDTNGNREYYMLPKYTTGRTSSDWYSIITSKDSKPVLSSTTDVSRTQYFNVGNALVQSGITEEVSCASGNVTSYTVTFPKAFSSGCVVMASLYYNNDTSSDAAAVNVAAGSYSNSQLVIKFSNTSGGTRSLRASWLAIGM